MNNRLADAMQVLQLELRRSAEGRSEIDALLEDDDDDVRAYAAVHVLSWDPLEATEVLVELSADPGLRGFEAGITLREYRAGRLGTDWVPRERSGKRAPVDGASLDAALLAHGLIMNGGLEHAWLVNPEAFSVAIAVFGQIRREDVKLKLYAARNLLRDPDNRGSNGDLNEDAGERERFLTDGYYQLPDPQTSIEEAEASDE